jgi:hypothetical protein
MVDEEIEKYLDIIEEEAAAQSIELDVDLAIEFAEELFLNELDEEAFEELVRRIEESGRFEPTFGPGEVKPTLDHTELMENGGDDEIIEEPGEPGLDDLPDADEEF